MKGTLHVLVCLMISWLNPCKDVAFVSLGAMFLSLCFCSHAATVHTGSITNSQETGNTHDNIDDRHRCGWRIVDFDGAYVRQIIGKVTNMEVRTHLICICICFRYVCRLTITNNGIHKGGRAAEGGAPTFVEAAEGRLHCWWWWGGKHSENICIYISNVSILPYLSPFLLFALRSLHTSIQTSLN